MSHDDKAKLEAVVDLVDKLSVNPDVDVKYYIPGVLVTTDKTQKFEEPCIQFEYVHDETDHHLKRMPLTKYYLEKNPEDLANLVTFSLEQFIGEIDSRQYGAQ